VSLLAVVPFSFFEFQPALIVGNIAALAAGFFLPRDPPGRDREFLVTAYALLFWLFTDAFFLTEFFTNLGVPAGVVRLGAAVFFFCGLYVFWKFTKAVFFHELLNK